MAFGGGGSVNSAAPSIASLQIQTSNWGRPIPLVYGQAGVAGNLIWYGDFTAIPQVSQTGGKGGGGGSMVTGYSYTAAVIIALAEGPITDVANVYAQKQIMSLSGLNLTAQLGTTTQTAPSFMSSGHPSEALPYVRLAYVYSPSYLLDSGGAIPTHVFEVKGLQYNGTGVAGVPDADIASVLSDVLTDARHGAGFASGLLGSTANMLAYNRALGLWVSPAYTEPTRASEIVDTLLKIANTAAVFSEGILKLIPYADGTVSGNGSTYAPTSTPVYALSDDDFISTSGSDPVLVSRIASSDAFNQVQVTFRERNQQYADSVAEAKDDAAIALYGLRPAPPETFHEVCDASTARMIAQLLLQRYTLLRNTYKFSLPLTYSLLEPMDIVTLTESTGTGLQAVPVRITSIAEAEDNSLALEAEDYLGTVASAPAYTYQHGGGYAADYNAPPGSVNAPFIFDAPGRLAPLGYEVWVAAAGSGALWGGATVWVSTDGASYKVAGNIEGRSRYGVTTGTLALGADPDTTNSVGVNLATSLGTLTGGTSADADNLNTLSLIDGELISYQAATLTSANHYTLGTRIRRGVYGTPIAAHSAGAPFARLDTGLFKIPYDPSLVGSNLYIKLTSFNVWGGGEEDLAGVPAYSHLIAGPIGAPADVTGFTATTSDNGVLLSWNDVHTTNLKQYEVRVGTSWASSTYVGKSLTTYIQLPPQPVGSVTWFVKALDRQDRYSINAAAVTLSVSAPGSCSPTVQVVDNNVLLFWSQPTSTQPILTYEIRRGATWAGGTIIGTKNGLFTSVFETAAGTNTYWVAAIDVAGNEGTPASVTASVSAPPDYVLKSNIVSAFAGTFSNAKLDQGSVVLPVDTATTFQTHFTAQSWAAPNDQVVAGFPVFIEKALSTGYYEEFYDYGSILASAKVTVASSGTVIAGAPGLQTDISVSPDNVTYTMFSNATSAYATGFRYVKVRVTATSSAGADVYRLNSLAIRIELKLKSDFGSQAVVSTDAGGTTTTFNVPFLGVTSINATPLSTGAAFATVDFAGGANPTTFKILLWNTSGARVSGTVHWEARGY